MQIENLADEVADLVKDYRSDDDIQMTSDRVLKWARQFDEENRLFVLSETKNILDKRYVSKSDALKFLKLGIEAIAEKNQYASPGAFLRNTVLLDLQPEGKSQTVLLEMLDDVARKYWDIDPSTIGATSKSNYLYIDDLLCTGNTVFYDLKEWLTGGGNQKVEEGANVFLLYIFLHSLNLDKLGGRFHYADDVSDKFAYKPYYGCKVENDYRKKGADLDFAFPLRENQPQEVFDYLESIDSPSDESVFRKSGMPDTEVLFSGPENRTRYENILLSKGLSILDSVSVQKENIRPLGYTLPSYKTLGFGTLSFTWRNVANNTPLVFWYSAPEWMPLFENKRTGPPEGETADIDLDDLLSNME